MKSDDNFAKVIFDNSYLVAILCLSFSNTKIHSINTHDKKYGQNEFAAVFKETLKYLRLHEVINAKQLT